MITRNFPSKTRKSAQAMTLPEMMVAISLSVIVLTMVMLLYIFGLRSFAAMGNYAELNSQSRLALDEMSREIRQSTSVLEAQTSGSTRWLLVANTNTSPSTIDRFSWSQSTGQMVWERWLNGNKTTKTNLVGCDLWSFEMYTRAPDTNGAFSSTKDLSLCKLINMNWKCTRTILGKKLNSEAVLTAEIVLRNKH
jgi:prepilin-type N-terminal cleavage/methylation domain-containing protein